MPRYVLLRSNEEILQRVARLKKHVTTAAQDEFSVASRLPKGVGVAFTEEGEMVVFTRAKTLPKNSTPEKVAATYDHPDRQIVGVANTADQWLIISTEGQPQSGMAAHLRPALAVLTQSVEAAMNEARSFMAMIDVRDMMQKLRNGNR